MKTQTIYIMQDSNICWDEKMCTETCRLRDNICKQIIDNIESEGRENIKGMSTDPVPCHLDWEPCQFIVEKIIYNS